MTAVNPVSQTGILIPNPDALYQTARECLLSPSGLDEQQLSAVFSQIMNHQIDYADLYFQYSRSEG